MCVPLGFHPPVPYTLGSNWGQTTVSDHTASAVSPRVDDYVLDHCRPLTVTWPSAWDTPSGMPGGALAGGFSGGAGRAGRGGLSGGGLAALGGVENPPAGGVWPPGGGQKPPSGRVGNPDFWGKTRFFSVSPPGKPDFLRKNRFFGVFRPPPFGRPHMTAKNQL